MQITKINSLLRFTGLMAMLLYCFSSAQAQQASITISPASIDAKVKRGSSYTQNFTITNSTGTRLRFRCSLSDVWYDAHNARMNGRPGTLPRSASNWIQFSPAEVIVEPNSSAMVKAVITTPLEVTGSFYSVPVFEGFPVTDTDATLVKTNTSTASIGVRFRGLMMFTTLEGSEYNIEIMSGKILPPSASSELEVVLDLRNRGTAHAKVRGAFAILDSSGTLAGRGEIGEKRYLPDQRDILRNKWSGELKPGNYIGIVTLSYNRVGMDPTSMVKEFLFTVK